MVRPAWEDMVRLYQLRGDARLRQSADRLAAAVRDDGVVYNEFDGQATQTRDWDIDAVPLIVDGVEWTELEKAITQRSMLLDLLLRDLYRDQKTITSGLVAPEMVFGHPRLHPQGGTSRGRRAARPVPARRRRIPFHRWTIRGLPRPHPGAVGHRLLDRRASPADQDLPAAVPGLRAPVR